MNFSFLPFPRNSLSELFCLLVHGEFLHSAKIIYWNKNPFILFKPTVSNYTDSQRGKHIKEWFPLFSCNICVVSRASGDCAGSLILGSIVFAILGKLTSHLLDSNSIRDRASLPNARLSIKLMWVVIGFTKDEGRRLFFLNFFACHSFKGTVSISLHRSPAPFYLAGSAFLCLFYSFIYSLPCF